MSTELNTEECFSIIQQASDLKVFSISFAGAEPTSRDDLIDIIQYCKEKKIYTSLATNGINFSADYINKLVSAGLGAVSVSIDSADEAINDKNRGVGTFEKILQTIRLLRETPLNFSLSITIGSNNYKDIGSTISYFAGLHINKIRIQFVSEGLHNSNRWPTLQLRQDKIFEVAKAIADYRFSSDLDISFACSTGYLNYLFLKKQPLDEFGTCSVGTNILTINFDGKITTCVHGLLPNEIIGDLKIQTLKSILDTPLFQLQKWLNKGDTSEIKEGSCPSCKILTLCKGGCKAMVFSKHNSFNFSDENCLGDEHLKSY